jgi:hypothetical protein
VTSGHGVLRGGQSVARLTRPLVRGKLLFRVRTKRAGAGPYNDGRNKACPEVQYGKV